MLFKHCMNANAISVQKTFAKPGYFIVTTIQICSYSVVRNNTEEKRNIFFSKLEIFY